MKHPILAIVIAVLALMLPNPHTCEFSKCPFKGQMKFENGCGYCEEGSDCWLLDKIHFAHPSWSYDQCDDYLFKN